MKTLLTCLIAAILLPISVFAQKKEKAESLKLKFGDIKPELFAEKHSLFDSTSDAIILNDIGHSRFEGNNEGWFTLIFKRHQRIKVLNKNGTDAANISIPLYGRNADKEKIFSLKASSFNLENGKVVESKLDSKQIFDEEVSTNYSYTKFGVPQVKEGSIIEVVYEVHSKYFFNLQSWEFQDTRYPRAWTEYTVEIPEFFHYVINTQGRYPFHLKIEEDSYQRFNISIPVDFSNKMAPTQALPGNVEITRWAIKDIPALKREPFIRSYNNHISKVEFQLAAYRFPDVPEKKVMPNWQLTAENLLNGDNFGGFLKTAKLFMGGDAKDIVGAETNPEIKARLIYNWLQDKIACTGNEGIYPKASARVVLKDQKGTVSDINMLMVAMLRQVDLDATPVLISTRNHGLTDAFYPLLNKYNYVLCRVNLDGKPFFLDATKPRLGFGHLDPQAYNAMGFVVAPIPEHEPILPDLVTETQNTLLFISNIDSLGWQGMLTINYGPQASYYLRNDLQMKGKEAHFKEIVEKFPSEIKLSGFRVDSLSNYESALKMQYELDLNALKEADMIYLNPFTGIESMDNPFKSAERSYPVELPSKFDEMTNIRIAIPQGYKAEELPKSSRIMLDEGDGYYEHLLAKQGDYVVIRTHLVINKTEFAPEEYETLRSFFSMMIARQQEQIVFKKSS